MYPTASFMSNQFHGIGPRSNSLVLHHQNRDAGTVALQALVLDEDFGAVAIGTGAAS